jgi:hypothetical protein
MPVKIFLRCAVAFAVAIPVYALADSFNAKPGAWEITMTTLTKGMMIPAEDLADMPPAQRARIEKAMQARAGKPSTHVTKSCVTKADLDQDRVLKSDEDEHCKKNIISKSASKIVYEQTCSGPEASKSTVTVEAKSPESLAATMDMVQQRSGGGKIHVDIKGKWLGASCAGIKD